LSEAKPVAKVLFCHDPVIAQAASRRVCEGETPNQFRDLDPHDASEPAVGLNLAKTLEGLGPHSALLAASSERSRLSIAKGSPTRQVKD
jgi:hypothetical protein